MNIICPNCHKKNAESSVNSCIYPDGNIFFTCPDCGIENVDSKWTEDSSSMEFKDANINRTILKIDAKKSKDGTVHFSSPCSKRTFCGIEEFDNMDFMDIRDQEVCEECMRSISEMLGIPVKTFRWLFNLKKKEE